MQRAAVWRKLVKPNHVVAVTGSCGKSTTVGLSALILSTQAKTWVSIGYNTTPAIAKRMLTARRSHRYWVGEVSGHAPGAIAEVAAFLRHDVAVVTTIGFDHYKNFRSKEAVAEEKSTLVSLLPAHGLAILNADEPLILQMAQGTAARVVTFGRSESADIRLIEADAAFPGRLRAVVRDGAAEFAINTQMIGDRWITAVLAAFALGRALGIARPDCVRAIEAWSPFPWRDSPHPLPNGAIAVADTMKAPFWTIPSSIETVRRATAPRKTFVMGTISDYKGTSRTKYLAVARDGFEAADRVVFVGKNSGHVDRLLDEFPDRLHLFTTTRESYDFLRETALPGELIYLKGSKGDHLERIILDWQAPIGCWDEGCGVLDACTSCRRLYPDRRREPADAFDPIAMLANNVPGASRA